MRHRQLGISLIIVLWLVVILTVIVFAVSREVRTEVQLSSHYQNQAKALALAESGVWRAVAMAHRKQAAALQGEHIELNGRIYPLSSEQGDLSVSLRSMQGLVDLNTAPDVLIEALLTRAADSPEQAAAITAALLDWRDEDDLVRLAGAESAQYLEAGLDHVPNNGPILSVSEFARVYGVTDALFQTIRPYVTVYSGDTRVDVSAVPAYVLEAIPGMTASDVETVLANRAAGRSVDLSSLTAQARQYLGTAQSRTVRVSSIAKVNNATSGIIAEVELGVEPESVAVLSWQQEVDHIFSKKVMP